MEIKNMRAREWLAINHHFHRQFINFAFSLFILLIACPGIAWSLDELPLKLPKVEGSKSFDMEIDQFNNKGIRFFQLAKFNEAEKKFRRGLNLARQLRDPSLGIISFNLALTLHKTGDHEAATPFFAQARKYARGNKKILGSILLEEHECGFNPNIDCKKLPSANMTIEGSN